MSVMDSTNVWRVVVKEDLVIDVNWVTFFAGKKNQKRYLEIREANPDTDTTGHGLLVPEAVVPDLYDALAEAVANWWPDES